MRYDRETVIDALRILAPTKEVARYALDIIERQQREIATMQQRQHELMADLEATRALLDGAIAGQETLQKTAAKREICLICGETIPEGRQVCPICAAIGGRRYDTSK